MRVAIVHERFTEFGGSEHVVEELHRMWPEAPIYAAILDRDALPPGFRDADVRTSRLQRRYHGGGYAHLLPLLPTAFATLDLSAFDLVITSHHAFANRVRAPEGTKVISYTYTPARWMWDRRMRRGEPGGLFGRAALAMFAATQRRADRAAALRTTGVVAISSAVADRIQRWWGRSASVVHPPVDVSWFTPDPGTRREDFFLLAGRLVPYKRPLVAVHAALRAGVRLVVAGDGRQRSTIERAAGPGIEVLGRVDDATLRDLYRRCRALVFPSEEDFGLVPVEAQACGTPVIALGLGGALDSVVDGVTGVLYSPQDEVGALAHTLDAFDPTHFDTATVREHAEHFSPERFRMRLTSTIEGILGGTP